MSFIGLYGKYFVLAWLVWKYVLRQGACPREVTRWIKWLHALILYVVWLSSWHAISTLLWSTLHWDALLKSFRNEPGAIWNSHTASIVLLDAFVGAPLFAICWLLALRRGHVVKWFLTLWPIKSLTGLSAATLKLKESVSEEALLLSWVTFAAFAIGVIAFYRNRRIRAELFTNPAESAMRATAST